LYHRGKPGNRRAAITQTFPPVPLPIFSPS
jgi:hypothetical protein